MEIRQLRSFLQILDDGQFTTAAQHLGLSQPALSQQIRRLERAVDAQLLDRSGRRVRPTAAGEVFAPHARQALEALNDARVALDELAGLQRGSLAIRTIQTINAYLMPLAVAEFADCYPNIRLHVDECAADEVERGVDAMDAQLGLGFVPPMWTDLDVEPLFTEELRLIVRPDHPLAAGSVVSPSELHGCPMALLPDGYCTRRLWNEYQQSVGVYPAVRVEMNTIAGVLTAVRELGLATVLPALALQCDASGTLTGVALPEPRPTRQVGLLWKRGGYRCAASRAFAETCRQLISTLPSSPSPAIP